MSKKKPIASVGEAKLRLVLTSIRYVVAIFCGVLG